MRHKGTNMNTVSIKKMHRISIIWGIVLLLLFTGLTTIGLLYKHKSQAYKELEKKLKDATTKYVEKKAMYTGSNLTINSEDLIKEEFLEALKVNDSDCKGYVLVKKVREHYEFEPYIKCDKYTTKGYGKK